MRSWSCSGLWRATSWVWCQWTSVTTEQSPPPAPSTLTSVSGTWILESRSSPWTLDQVRLGLRFVIDDYQLGQRRLVLLSACEKGENANRLAKNCDKIPNTLKNSQCSINQRWQQSPRCSMTRFFCFVSMKTW